MIKIGRKVFICVVALVVTLAVFVPAMALDMLMSTDGNASAGDLSISLSGPETVTWAYSTDGGSNWSTDSRDRLVTAEALGLETNKELMVRITAPNNEEISNLKVNDVIATSKSTAKGPETTAYVYSFTYQRDAVNAITYSCQYKGGNNNQGGNSNQGGNNDNTPTASAGDLSISLSGPTSIVWAYSTDDGSTWSQDGRGQVVPASQLGDTAQLTTMQVRITAPNNEEISNLRVNNVEASFVSTAKGAETTAYVYSFAYQKDAVNAITYSCNKKGGQGGNEGSAPTGLWYGINGNPGGTVVYFASSEQGLSSALPSTQGDTISGLTGDVYVKVVLGQGMSLTSVQYQQYTTETPSGPSSDASKLSESDGVSVWKLNWDGTGNCKVQVNLSGSGGGGETTPSNGDVLVNVNGPGGVACYYKTSAEGGWTFVQANSTLTSGQLGAASTIWVKVEVPGGYHMTEVTLNGADQLLTSDNIYEFTRSTTSYDRFIATCKYNGWYKPSQLTFGSIPVADPNDVRNLKFSGWRTKLGDSYNPEGVIKTPDQMAAQESAYAFYVDDKVMTVKAQLTAGTTAESENTSMRFVTTVDSLRYQKAGFRIQIQGREANDWDCSYVYTGIQAGEDVKAPSEVSGASQSEYITAFALRNIPLSAFGTEITATPYWVTLDGATVFGEAKTYTVNQILAA